MISIETIQLLTRKLSGEASNDELLQLDQAIASSEELYYLSEVLSSYWLYPSQDFTKGQDEITDAHFQYVMETASIEEEKIKSLVRKNTLLIWIKKLSVAAVLAGSIFSLFYLFNNKDNNKVIVADKNNEVSVKPGVRSKIILPDGSCVWLNSSSKIIYSNKFNKKIREVSLEGEAFFNVVRNVDRPFVVHTSAIDIKVLGTSFNVKSYPLEKTIETTLIHGAVEVVKKNEPTSPKVLLRPYEKLVFQKDDSIYAGVNIKGHTHKLISKNITSGIAISMLPINIPDSSLKETSWVYNKLIFEGDTFEELGYKMERWFNVKINFQNEEVSSYRFRGVFKNENIIKALKALQLTASFNFKINNNEIYIYK